MPSSSSVRTSVLLALLAAALQAATPSDSAIRTAFRQSGPALSHVHLWHRTAVTPELDLVVALAGPQPIPTEPALWWSQDRKLGLFLQEKNNPGRVYVIAITPGFPDCAASLERVTATGTVISCEGEKSTRHPNLKWVYDIRAKQLLAQFSYQPFAIYQIFPHRGGAVFIGTDTQHHIAVEYQPNREPALRLLSPAASQPWLDRAGPRTLDLRQPPPPSVIPPLPPTTYEQFAAARPERVKNGGYTREATQIEESIGPWHREEGRVWFARTFYDGEGYTGLGAFGYFDTATKQLQTFTPPELADWSVSALAVTPQAIWLARVHNGEWGSTGGGLLRYDRGTSSIQLLKLPGLITRLTNTPKALLAATDTGFALIQNDTITRYFLDRTTAGRLQIAKAVLTVPDSR